MTGASRRKRASSTEVLPEAGPKTAQLDMYYHVMKKRRVTLSLDEDVVQALESIGRFVDDLSRDIPPFFPTSCSSST